MTTLSNVGSLAINVLVSSGTRTLISNYMKIPKNQALVFNGIDVLVNGVSSYFLGKKYLDSETDVDPSKEILSILASRTISVITASLVTAYAVGSFHPGAALMLNATAGIFGIAAYYLQNTFFPADRTFIFT